MGDSLLIYILLGVLQGFLEWIPISSEGIVTLSSQIVGIGYNPVDVAIFLHGGTTIAVLVYFWRDWLDVLTLRNRDLFKFLAVATLVSLTTGFLVYRLVRSFAVGYSLLFLIGIALLATGFLQSRKISLGLNNLQLAFVAGVLQGLAVIPGFSRSGATIFGLSLGNIEPDKILKYSYMMSVPAIIAADVYLLLQENALAINAWPALASSFIVGLTSLHFLLEISRKTSFSTFAYLFGVLCIIGAIVSLL